MEKPVHKIKHFFIGAMIECLLLLTCMGGVLLATVPVLVLPFSLVAVVALYAYANRLGRLELYDDYMRFKPFLGKPSAKMPYTDIRTIKYKYGTERIEHRFIVFFVNPVHAPVYHIKKLSFTNPTYDTIKKVMHFLKQKDVSYKITPKHKKEAQIF